MAISDKLRAVIALYLQPGYPGEKEAARNRGEVFAAKEGLTFDEAVAAFKADPTGDMAKAGAAARSWRDDIAEAVRRGAEEGLRQARAAAEEAMRREAEAANLRDMFARWARTTDDDDRDEWRSKIEAVLKRSGKTFAQAFNENVKAADLGAFAHVEASMEADHPGHKRRRAQEARDKAAALARRRAAVLARFGGSEEVALAPCDGEQMLIDALARWRRPNPHCPRWTHSLDGWSDWYGEPPGYINEAIRAAIPLPTTFAEAESEWNYWRERDHDFGALAGDLAGDCHLDGIVIARMQIIENMIAFELPAQTVSDILARARFYRAKECHNDRDENRIFDDIESLAARARDPSAQRGQIAEAIRDDLGRTDRSIARELHCSPTTVGRVRRELGLNDGKRTVRRGGQIFEADYQRPAENRVHA